MLPQLPAHIPEDKLLCSVNPDGAYNTKACHEATRSVLLINSNYQNHALGKTLAKELCNNAQFIE